MHTFYNSYRIAVPRKMHGHVQDAHATRERPGATQRAKIKDVYHSTCN